MNRLKPIAVVVILSAIALAGCTSSDPGPSDPNAVPDEGDLQKGKGAIAGLLVDDAFRPIHLIGPEEDRLSEFQFRGFLLVHETGQQVRTNANGEFFVTNIDPGAYTIRGEVDGHEVTQQRVNVEEGRFEEATIEARRVSSDSNVVLTQEFSVFIPCAADFVVNGIVMNCVLDLSGDTFRSSFTVDYSDLGDNVTFLVSEVLTSQDGGYTMQVRESDGSTAGGDRYAVAEVPADTRYYKIINEYGVKNEDDNGQDNNWPWRNPGAAHEDAEGNCPTAEDEDTEIRNSCNGFATILFISPPNKDQFESAGSTLDPAFDALPCDTPVPVNTCPNNPIVRGLDARFGVKAQFVQSLFLGEPEIDLASYQTLTEE